MSSGPGDGVVADINERTDAYFNRTREVIGVWSSLVPREQVPASIHYFES